MKKKEKTLKTLIRKKNTYLYIIKENEVEKHK